MSSFSTEGRSLIAQFGRESNCFVLTKRALEDKRWRIWTSFCD